MFVVFFIWGGGESLDPPPRVGKALPRRHRHFQPQPVLSHVSKDTLMGISRRLTNDGYIEVLHYITLKSSQRDDDRIRVSVSKFRR